MPPGGSQCKEPACNAGDLGSIPGLGRSPGGGHGNPLQYSCLETQTHTHTHTHTDTRILVSLKKGSPAVCNNMDEPGR